MTITLKDNNALFNLIALLPKAELHLHIEGTLEPEMMFDLAARNGVKLPYSNPEALRAAYRFQDLQSFLDLYYAGASVLCEARDFSELTQAYLRRMAGENVRHVEIFFDPQTHTERGIAFDSVIEGITDGLEAGSRNHGISSRLILCFLRHLPAEAAMATYDQALRFRDKIAGFGLDSAEAGNPPSKFRAVFDRLRAEGFPAVAHAGEEGPAEYIRQARDLLKVVRIDHGVGCSEDQGLVNELAQSRLPLTVCPLSNIRLGVFSDMSKHNAADLLRRGLCVTINSDDPAYFGGYLNENYYTLAKALKLTSAEIAKLAKNSFEASFLPSPDKQRFSAEIDTIMETFEQ